VILVFRILFAAMTLFSRPKTYLFWLPLTLLLAASNLNTKAAGLAWLWFILAGLLAWWQSRVRPKSDLKGYQFLLRYGLRRLC
jgi:hypothetical protein